MRSFLGPGRWDALIPSGGVKNERARGHEHAFLPMLAWNKS